LAPASDDGTFLYFVSILYGWNFYFEIFFWNFYFILFFTFHYLASSYCIARTYVFSFFYWWVFSCWLQFNFSSWRLISFDPASSSRLSWRWHIRFQNAFLQSAFFNTIMEKLLFVTFSHQFYYIFVKAGCSWNAKTGSSNPFSSVARSTKFKYQIWPLADSKKDIYLEKNCLSITETCLRFSKKLGFAQFFPKQGSKRYYIFNIQKRPKIKNGQIISFLANSFKKGQIATLPCRT